MKSAITLCAILAVALASTASVTPTFAALREDPVTGRFGPVEVVAKKPWRAGSQGGFTVSYRLDGKTYRGAKVFCTIAGRPAYAVENLDRGDGAKLDLSVAAEDGADIADDLAPRYMNWAIDLWLQACR